MKVIICNLIFFLSFPLYASNAIPVGNDNNILYYKIGGGRNFSLPASIGTDKVTLSSKTNLGLGYGCSAFNPALSITNTMNDLKNSLYNLTQDVISNATGSLIMMPMYELAKSNPTLYALLNNQLISANAKLEVSTKSCETVREQIAGGENPYHKWGSIAINDQWKKKISLATSNDIDINQVKKEIDDHSGDDGISWINGNKESDGSYTAGGKNQPPIHVIADAVKAGYNAILNRDLQLDDAPNQTIDNEMIRYFFSPQNAIDWITNVVGDQTITTCNDNNCKNKQNTVVGHGLLPLITSCQFEKEYCVDVIYQNLRMLILGEKAIIKENLELVSAGGIAISPDVIYSIRNLDPIQQNIIINKLSQEIAGQRAIDKAFMARNILAVGAQVPVISANYPAQEVINHAIKNIDTDIQSLAFEGQIRKQMISDTLSELMKYSNEQQKNAKNISIFNSQPLMENGAQKEK